MDRLPLPSTPAQKQINKTMVSGVCITSPHRKWKVLPRATLTSLCLRMDGPATPVTASTSSSTTPGSQLKMQFQPYPWPVASKSLGYGPVIYMITGFRAILCLLNWESLVCAISVSSAPQLNLTVAESLVTPSTLQCQLTPVDTIYLPNIIIREGIGFGFSWMWENVFSRKCIKKSLETESWCSQSRNQIQH